MFPQDAFAQADPDVPSSLARGDQVPLPFDDEGDVAVPFVLTAAAHRAISGGLVPPLRAVRAHRSAQDVVEEPAEDSGTTRIQARALFRSGMPLATVAAALGRDVAVVEEWTADMGDELARRRRRTASVQSRPRTAASGTHIRSGGDEAGRDDAALLPGLAFGLAEFGDGWVAFVHDRADTIAVLLDAVRSALALTSRQIRVAVRLAHDVPADRMRAALAGDLGVDPAGIVVGRAAAAAPGSLVIRVDIRDAGASDLVRSWIDDATSGLRGWDSNPQTFRLTADCSAS